MKTEITRGERYVGIFVIGALAVAIIFAVFSQAQRFQSYRRYYITVTDTYGLDKGNPVELNGLKVGQITDIELRENNYIRILFQVDKEQHFSRIKTDASVQIQAPLPLVGGALIVQPGAASQPKGDMEEMRYVEPEFSTKTVFEDIASAVKEFRELAERMTDEKRAGVLELLGQKSAERISTLIDYTQETVRDDVLPIADQLEQMVAGLNSGERSLADIAFGGKPVMQILLGDQIQAQLEKVAAGEAAMLEILLGPRVWNEVEVAARSWETIMHGVLGLMDETKLLIRKSSTAIDDLEPVLAMIGNNADELDRMLDTVGSMLTDVRALTAAFAETSDQIPGMVRTVRGSLVHVNDLLEAFRKHWLISGFVTPQPQQSYGLRQNMRPNPYGE